MNLSSMKTVAERHGLAAYHKQQYWRAFQGNQRRWPWTLKIRKEWIFLWLQAVTLILKANCV